MPIKYNLEMYKQKAELCKTFSDPTRLMIISELRDGEKSVGELVDTLQSPQAVISRHLAVLRHRGVVKARREGVSIYYSLTNLKIVSACDIVHEILLEQAASNREMADKLTL
jgi:DNA-binding transcriptional ArsR family regulator